MSTESREMVKMGAELEVSPFYQGLGKLWRGLQAGKESMREHGRMPDEKMTKRSLDVADAKCEANLSRLLTEKVLGLVRCSDTVWK